MIVWSLSIYHMYVLVVLYKDLQSTGTIPGQENVDRLSVHMDKAQIFKLHL